MDLAHNLSFEGQLYRIRLDTLLPHVRMCSECLGLSVLILAVIGRA